jgi:hypothetical protein
MKSLPATIVDEFLGHRREVVDEIFENEQVLWKGPANHIRGIEGRGGWLRVTPTRLLFRSHGFNFQNQPVDILRTDIVSIEPSRFFGVFRCLEVTVNGKPSQKFVVWDREGLVKLIRERSANVG